MDIKFRKMLPEDVYVVSGMEKQMFGTCTNAGANLLDENGLTVNEAPDAEGAEACKELGRKLAAW